MCYVSLKKYLSLAPILIIKHRLTPVLSLKLTPLIVNRMPALKKQ